MLLMVVCDPSTAFTENRKAPWSFGDFGGEEEYVRIRYIVNAFFLYVVSASSLLQKSKSDRPLSSRNASRTDIVDEEEL